MTSTLMKEKNVCSVWELFPRRYTKHKIEYVKELLGVKMVNLQTQFMHPTLLETFLHLNFFSSNFFYICI